MIEIDGNDGGGQILRTALTLSMLDGEPVSVENVRGNRSRPGLGHQHLAAVETAAAVCNATVDGADLRSETVTFEPGPPTGGTYEAEISTAGSVTLLFDTLLPLATALSEPLVVRATGGTDVKWSPPWDYYSQVKLPVVRAHGLGATVTLGRRGFYPKGGGVGTLRLWPSDLTELALGARPDSDGARPDFDGARMYSTAAHQLEDAEVAERQAAEAAQLLAAAGVEPLDRTVRYVDASCPGSVIVIELTTARDETARPDGDDRAGKVRAGADAFGEQGTPAEAVAEEAVDRALAIQGGSAPVDSHLADQLLGPLALADGRLRVPEMTTHVETCLGVLERFGYEVDVTELDDGGALLER